MATAYCLKCKQHTELVNTITDSSNGKSFLKGDCSRCGRSVTKLLGKVTKVEGEDIAPPAAEICYIGKKAQVKERILLGGGSKTTVIYKDSHILIEDWPEGDICSVSCPDGTIRPPVNGPVKVEKSKLEVL